MSAKDILAKNAKVDEEVIKQVVDENERLFKDLETALEEFGKLKEENKKLSNEVETLKEENKKLTRERDHFQKFSYTLEQHMNLPKMGENININSQQSSTKVIHKTDLSGIDLIRKNAK